MKKIMFNDKYGLTEAVLEGRKTMTRRIIKGDFEKVKAYHANGGWYFIADTKDGDSVEVKPAYEIGDELAVAQSYSNLRKMLAKRDFKRTDALYDKFYRVMQMGEVHDGMPGWSNKMFVRADLMPNRIRITDIKVERLQVISEDDCLREGIVKTDCVAPYGFPFPTGKWKNYRTPQDAFACLIDKVSGTGTWDTNPWVYAYTFEFVR